MSPGQLKFKVLRLAAQEILEQASFYESRSGATLAARWRTAVNEAIRSLRSHPERGNLVGLDSSILRDIRHLPIEGFPKHLVFYRFDAATSTVIILRVLHGARDIPALLEGGGQE